MAREILFRGKRVDTGQWVISDCFFQCAEEIKLWDNPNRDGWVCVKAETLGQYTGLTDKNKTKIFESDIVEFETNVNCIASELKPYWKNCIEKQCTLGGGTWWVRKDQAVVQWNSKDGMWDLKVYNNGRYKRKSKLFTYRESDYVVIGNIYDNPELLEGNDA